MALRPVSSLLRLPWLYRYPVVTVGLVCSVTLLFTRSMAIILSDSLSTPADVV